MLGNVVFSLTIGWGCLSKYVSHLLHRHFVRVYPHSRFVRVRTFVLDGHHTRFVTLLLWIILTVDIHSTSVNAGFCTRLYRLSCYQPEAAVGPSIAMRVFCMVYPSPIALKFAFSSFGRLLPVFSVIPVPKNLSERGFETTDENRRKINTSRMNIDLFFRSRCAASILWYALKAI
jgi:hypothetical protein